MIKIGDTVRIVAARECRFGYDRHMSGYIGKEAIVENAVWRRGPKAHSFTLDIDNGRYAWCDRCIELVEDIEIEESDESFDVLFGGVVV